MINWKMIYKIMGFLLFIEAGFLTLCTILSFYYQEPDRPAFVISTLITLAVGIPLSRAGKNAERKLSRRDGYIVVTLAWILFSIFGMLPYYISEYIPSITNAPIPKIIPTIVNKSIPLLFLFELSSSTK